jgi:hypothetical protein
MSDQLQRPSGAPGTKLEGLGTAYTPAPSGPEPREDRLVGSVPVGSSAVLYVRRGPQSGQRFVLASDAVTVLGRHTDCGIMLSDVSVSRRHAEIHPAEDHFVLVDLGSLNGSYVNRRPIDTAVLADGDEVAVGVFRLTFHAGGPTHHES